MIQTGFKTLKTLLIGASLIGIVACFQNCGGSFPSANEQVSASDSNGGGYQGTPPNFDVTCSGTEASGPLGSNQIDTVSIVSVSNALSFNLNMSASGASDALSGSTIHQNAGAVTTYTSQFGNGSASLTINQDYSGSLTYTTVVNGQNVTSHVPVSCAPLNQ